MSNTPSIGILSDSHDHRANIIKAVDIFNANDCSLVIHAGDFIAPFTAREFSRLSCPLIGVYGNNDGERKGLESLFTPFGSIRQAPYEFEHKGRRFFLMHEPYYLADARERPDIDVVVYGHTHKIDIVPGKPLVLNPGETCSWITGRPTVVLLDLVSLEPRIVELD